MKIKYIGHEPIRFPFVSTQIVNSGDILDIDETIANELSKRDDFEVIKQPKNKEA